VHIDRNVAMAVFLSCVIGMTIGAVVADNTRAPEAQDDEAMALDDLPSLEPKAPEAPKVGVRQVLGVLSGDTVEVEEEGPVRLLGVDIRQIPGGKPVDPAVSKALLESLVAGKSLDVRCDSETADTDFRSDDGLLLVYLMTPDGILVNTELIARGGAVADLTRTYARKDELMIAERDARWEGRGMWETVATAGARETAPARRTGASETRSEKRRRARHTRRQVPPAVMLARQRWHPPVARRCPAEAVSRMRGVLRIVEGKDLASWALGTS
jgi:endonuclease YncB( thermonuclease family)